MSTHLIKLVDYTISIKWSHAVSFAEVLVEDSQMALLPGSLFDQQHLLDQALERVKLGDLAGGAALLYALADRNSLIEPESSDNAKG